MPRKLPYLEPRVPPLKGGPAVAFVKFCFGSQQGILERSYQDFSLPGLCSLVVLYFSQIITILSSSLFWNCVFISTGCPRFSFSIFVTNPTLQEMEMDFSESFAV